METHYGADARRSRVRLGSVFALVLALVAALRLPAAGPAAAVTPPAPTAATSGVSNVSYSSAILYGYVNAKGAATNYYFQYGTTTAYGAQSPLSPAGSATSTVKVSQAITGLQAATKYHYRLVAVGPGGDGGGQGPHLHDGEDPALARARQHPQPGGVRQPVLRRGHALGNRRREPRDRAAGQPLSLHRAASKRSATPS